MKDVTCDKLFCSFPLYLYELFENSTYPWEILPYISDYTKKIYDHCLKNGFTEFADGVLIGKDVSISEAATIIAPSIIGHESEIRPGAYIRGNVITGSRCVIGNSSEVKNSVILDHAQIPHFNYVGDSVIGNYAHLGAGAVCSNLKGDKTLVTVKTEPPINSGLKKFGAILADHAEIGCGCVLNPGTVIGQNTRIYPLISVRRVVPANSIMKSADCIVSIK